jgi:hypothetical protein
VNSLSCRVSSQVTWWVGERIDTVTTDGDEKFRAMQARLADLLPRLNERDRRLALATEAKSWGYGGITAVNRATGVSRKTIQRGMIELSDDSVEGGFGRVRASGGGRKKAEVANPELVDALAGGRAGGLD